MTKGIIKKTKQGWIVIYDEILGENIVKKNQKSLPLHPDDVKKFSLLSEMFDNFEARIKKDPKVDFEIVDHFDNNGPEHFKKFAKLIHKI
jgi:hypothetical protein